LVLVVALLLAGVAAFAIFRYLRGIEEDIAAGQEQIPVFRAIQAIAEGTEGNVILQGENVLYEESIEQKEDLPADAITTAEELNSVLSGRVAAGPVSANQVLTRNQWVQLTVEIVPLAEQIPEGKQALTISPGIIEGVNGFVEPGDRVNVIVSVDIEFRLTALAQTPDFGIPAEPTGGEEATTEEEQQIVQYTRYVLQGLPVLAVGRAIRPDEDAPQTVSVDGQAATADGAAVEGEAAAEPEVTAVYTLEVTPEQAERLVYALRNGNVYLTLVPADFVEVETKGITIDTLFEGDLTEDIFGQ
jgi:pilus assembly protein CpaB